MLNTTFYCSKEKNILTILPFKHYESIFLLEYVKMNHLEIAAFTLMWVNFHTLLKVNKGHYKTALKSL